VISKHLRLFKSIFKTNFKGIPSREGTPKAYEEYPIITADVFENISTFQEIMSL
jgi:hypothetical protein